MDHGVVIGGTRGLGREVVRRMCEVEDRVSVIGRNDPPEEDRESKARYWITDLLDAQKRTSIIDKIVAEQGPVNSLVFC